MSEYLMQSLYAIVATAALAQGTRTIVYDNFSKYWWANVKPLSCTYCLTFWWAILVTIAVIDYPGFVQSIVTVLMVHFLSFFLIQRTV